MKKGFRKLKFEHIQADMEEYHKSGAKPGVYVGFESLNDYYTMKLGTCTDWTGYPASGKSQILMELLYNTSAMHGWKHLLYVPDIGERMELMDILIHIHTGKTFDKKYSNHISLREAYSAANWLMEHFIIMDQEDPKETLSPVEFWEQAVEVKKEDGIQTATIDSWKDLFHDIKSAGDRAMYLSKVLPIRNKIAEKENLHFHTIIHPKNPVRTKDGKIQQPQADDMEGGAQWNNSGKNIISCHRETFDTTIVDIQILKVKPRVVGKRGQTTLEFDVAKSRYYEICPDNGGHRMYAGEWKKRKEASVHQPILSNHYERDNEEMPF